MTRAHSRPLFFVQRKTFPLILCVRQKHPFSRSIEINDCTIPGIKDPPPRRLAPSPPRWRHVKNCRALYQRNLWAGYRNAQSGSACDHPLRLPWRTASVLLTPYLPGTISPADDLLFDRFTRSNELERGFNEGVFTAAKLYPANATTNSSHGVTSIDAIMPVLERMEKIGMPLLVHGEVTHADIDIFDREARFIESVMEPLPSA